MSAVAVKNENPVVFFDISLGPQQLGRVKFLLYADRLPKTCENFRQFCTGEHRNAQNKPIGYKDSVFHRVIKGFMIQGGDFISFNGLGSYSIFGTNQFEDEGFYFNHDKYSLSMANSGSNTNGCQFFITLDKQPHLDGKHVVFGEVVEGQDIIEQVQRVGIEENDRPRVPIKISNCGEM